LGWQDIGRTEKRIAKLLSNGKIVWLKTANHWTVSASLVAPRRKQDCGGKGQGAGYNRSMQDATRGTRRPDALADMPSCLLHGVLLDFQLRVKSRLHGLPRISRILAGSGSPDKFLNEKDSDLSGKLTVLPS